MAPASALTRLVWNHGRTLSMLLLAVGALAFVAAGVVALNPGTTTVVEHSNNQSFATSVTTSAVVTGNTSLYEQGERLSGQSVYLTGATPVLALNATTAVPADRPVEVEHRLVLVVRATRGGDTFYESERTVIDRSQRVTGGTATASGTVNVTALVREMDRTQSEVGTAGTVSAALRLRVAYRTDSYAGELAANAPLLVSNRAYWLEGTLADRSEDSERTTREVPASPDLALLLAFLALGVVSAAGGVGTAYWRDGLDPESIETDLVHARHEEWISAGEFPTWMDHRYVALDGLEDLVDVAIDSEKRVIFDDRFDAYAVVDGDLVYYYTTEPFAVGSWLEA